MGKSREIDLSPLIKIIEKKVTKIPDWPKTIWWKQFSNYWEAIVRSLENFYIIFLMLISFGLILLQIIMIPPRADAFIFIKQVLDWKILAFLAFPLFYRALRRLIEEIQGYGGFTRKFEDQDASETDDKQITKSKEKY